jgi:hypothetical protein
MDYSAGPVCRNLCDLILLESQLFFLPVIVNMLHIVAIIIIIIIGKNYYLIWILTTLNVLNTSLIAKYGTVFMFVIVDLTNNISNKYLFTDYTPCSDDSFIITVKLKAKLKCLRCCCFYILEKLP